jgi:uncharacterized protein YndB with AHSA1/START domain
VLEEQDADFIFQIDFPTPPSVTWEWIHNPEKRNIWGGVPDAWSVGDRPQGRSGVGSSNHCAHGNSVSTQVVVDWHPFEYYTTHSMEKGRHTFTETMRFEALPDGGTRLRHAGRLHMPMPRFIRRAALKFVLVTQNHYDQMIARAVRLANEEFTKTTGDHDAVSSRSLSIIH